MSRILIPRSDSQSVKIIEPSDFEKYFSSDIVRDYRKTGFVVTAGSGLSVDIAAGTARVKGLYVEADASENVGSLTASSPNYIYITLARDSNSEAESWSFTKNTNGVLPADSFFIANAVCGGSTVTTVNQTEVVDAPLVINTGEDSVIAKKSVLIADFTTPTAVTASSAATGYASSKAKDDNTSTVWKTDASTNPFIYADMGSAVNLCAIAWYNDAATTETTVKIQTSTDASSWTDKRTILTSNLVASVYNFIRFNTTTARYIRIYGSSGSSLVLSAAEIKVQKKTDAELLISHGHLAISNSDTGIELDGTA
jgi:hypothetical protein|tara:strand:+ start:3940 stop:4875 length:936 start_codon:yes stop_codon:yes gene_type:complete